MARTTLTRTPTTPAPEPTPPPVAARLPVRRRTGAVVAAASTIPMDGTGWRDWRFGDQRWQEEAWRHYDICGEAHFAATLMGNALSRCRLYVAQLDKLGRPGDEAKDPKVASLSETAFGGPSEKAEAQRVLGVQLFTAGEAFIVAESVASARDDRWYVVSNSEIKRAPTGGIQVTRSNALGPAKYTLRPGKDLLMRVWTPHPRRVDMADSSFRATLPILREIEQLSKMVFTQVDSRLAGAGMLLFPREAELPREPDDPPGVKGFSALLTRNAEKAMTDQGSASAQIPIIVTAAAEHLDKVRLITFQTPFQAEARELRGEAVRRLALGLDMPPEVLLGQGGMNHWGAWANDDAVIKTQIVPLLARIAEALTLGYLRPALKVLGKDPDQFTFWYDTSPLTVAPNRQADAVVLGERGVLSAAAQRKAGNWSEDDKPSDEELDRAYARSLILNNPKLMGVPDVMAAAGLDWEVPPDAVGAGGAPALPPGGDAQFPAEADQARELPPMPDLPGPPDTGPLTEAALHTGADLVVRRVLEMAGKEALDRGSRGQHRDVPAYALHTVITLDPAKVGRLLDGKWDQARELAGRLGMDPDVVVDMLRTYTAGIMTMGRAHDPRMFAGYLDKSLDLIGHGRCTTACRNPLHPVPCPATPVGQP